MDEAIKRILSEHAQQRTALMTQMISEQQSIQLLMDKIRTHASDDSWHDILVDMKQTYPNIESEDNLIDFVNELKKFTDEQRVIRDRALGLQEEKRVAKVEASTKLRKLKEEMEKLLEQNHQLEEKLKPENDTLPLILKLMTSVKSIPKKTAKENNNVDDSIAQHLNSIINQIGDL